MRRRRNLHRGTGGAAGRGSTRLLPLTLAWILVVLAVPASAATPAPTASPLPSHAAVEIPFELPDLGDPADPEGLAEAEGALRDLLVDTSGLSDALGPAGLALLAELRLELVQVDTQGVVGLLAVGGAGAPDVPVAPSIVGTPEGAATGAFSSGAMAMASAISDGFERDHSSAPPEAVSMRERTEGGVTTTAELRVKTSVSTSGSRVIVDSSATFTGSQVDAATKAILSSYQDSSVLHAEIDACPDERGIVELRITGTTTVDASGMPGGSRVSLSIDSAIDAQVGDDAWLTSTSNTSDVAIEAGAAADSDARTAGVRSESSLGRNADGTIDASRTRGEARATANDGGFTDTELGDHNSAITTVVALVSEMALRSAQEQWRDGECVRIESNEPKGREVDPEEVVELSVRPMHRIDGSQLDKPSVGSLAGEGVLEPADTPQDAPSALTWTAPADEGAAGTVTLMSTSNRGIGTLALPFTVATAEYDVKVTGTFELTGVSSPLGFKGKVSGTAGSIRRGDGADAARGDATLRMSLAPRSGSMPAGCKISGASRDATLIVDVVPQGDASDDIVIKLRLEDTVDEIKVRCPMMSVDVPLPGAGGYGQFFEGPLPEITLPADGGTVKVTGTRRFPAGQESKATAKVTLTKRPR